MSISNVRISKEKMIYNIEEYHLEQIWNYSAVRSRFSFIIYVQFYGEYDDSFTVSSILLFRNSHE